MPKAKKTRNFAQVKRIINPKDIKSDKEKKLARETAEAKKQQSLTREIPQVASSLFLQYNTSLVPPYQVLVDTNFINFSISNKLDIIPSMMDTLYAKAIPIITDCVLAELEKLGPKYRIALRIAKDPRFERIKCSHTGTYADDCLVNRVMMHKCYIVATNDQDLRRRLRKIPGVPIMFVGNHKYQIERLPDAVVH